MPKNAIPRTDVRLPAGQHSFFAYVIHRLGDTSLKAVAMGAEVAARREMLALIMEHIRRLGLPPPYMYGRMRFRPLTGSILSAHYTPPLGGAAGLLRGGSPRITLFHIY